ncbi:Phosphoadenosine phosphosulfate reductase [Bienertia sinuspersici]
MLKAWTHDTDVNQEDFMTLPIWIHVHSHYKYWGLQVLTKMIKPIGMLVKVDHTITKREKLAYARCMIKVKIGQAFPSHVLFIDEHDQKQVVPFTYEWRPVQCSNCKGIWHDGGQCYKDKREPTHKTWRPEQVNQENINSKVHQGANTGKLELEKCKGQGGSRTNQEAVGTCITNSAENKEGKKEAEEKVYSKLDRVMADDQWVNIFTTTQAIFLPAGVSDHSPPVIVGNNTVGKGWSQGCQGCFMFQFRKKLKAVKKELKELNKLQFSNIHIEKEDAHSTLLQIQKELQEDPANTDLCYKEKRATDQYKKKLHCYGDDNTTLFHRSPKAQRLRSNLYTIYNMQGQLKSDPESVSNAFLKYYEQLIVLLLMRGRDNR